MSVLTKVKDFFVNWNRKKSVVTIVALIVFFTILTSSITWKPAIALILFKWFTGSLMAEFGLDPWLTRAIAIPLALLAVLSLWLLAKKPRWLALVFIGFEGVVFCLGMYYMTQDYFFDPQTGKFLRYYAVTETGYYISSRPGFSPFDGSILEEATPTITRQIKLWKQNQEKALVRENEWFFNPLTGKGCKWYYKDEHGRILISDTPGFDTISGQRVNPVTPEVVKEYLEQIGKMRGNEGSLVLAPTPTATPTTTPTIAPTAKPEKFPCRPADYLEWLSSIDFFYRDNEENPIWWYYEDRHGDIHIKPRDVFEIDRLKKQTSANSLIESYKQKLCEDKIKAEELKEITAEIAEKFIKQESEYIKRNDCNNESSIYLELDFPIFGGSMWSSGNIIRSLTAMSPDGFIPPIEDVKN